MSLPGNYNDTHLLVDDFKRIAWLDGRPMILTRKEFDLLATLVGNATEIVRREVLMSQIWGYSMEIRTRTLDVHIRRLRKKLGQFGDTYIETIFGVGYRFQPYRESRPAPTWPGLLAASA